MMLSVPNKSVHRGWHVIWGDSHLTLRIRSGCCVGEDEFGELRFGVSPHGCFIEFTIDDQDNLWISVVGNSYQIDSGVAETVVRVPVEPGALIELPNNLLHISSGMRRTTSSGVLVKLIAVAPSNPEMVADADYGERLALDERPRLNELIETPKLNPEWSGEFRDKWAAGTLQETAFQRVERKTRYKWFLLGSVIVVSIFIATPTSIEIKPTPEAFPFGLAPTAPVPDSQVPDTQQHVALLDTLDQVLVNAGPDDHSAVDFATESFKAVLLSEPLNVRAQEGLAGIQEQLARSAEGEVELTEPSSTIVQSSNSTRRMLRRAEALLYDGDIIAPRGNG